MSRTNIKRILITKEDELVEKIMDEQFSLMPELEDKYTSKMIEKSKSDTAYNLNYLAQSILIAEKNIFVKYYKWLFNVLKERGIGKEVLNIHLEAIKNVLKEELKADDFKIAVSFLDAAKIKDSTIENNYYNSFLVKDNPYFEEAKEYLEYILNMEREKAVALIVKLAEDDIEIEDLYLHIFQQVQYEIGRLWQLNKITIAQEHYATSVTQLAMSQLYPKIFSAYQKGKKALTTCIGDELHELGIRMVADLLELNGWDTIHLGANTPLEEIINLLEQQSIDLLAISATLPFQLENVKLLITKLKNNSKLEDIKIMVGGKMFMENDQLWRKIGADGFASDAKKAVKVADSLL